MRFVFGVLRVSSLGAVSLWGLCGGFVGQSVAAHKHAHAIICQHQRSSALAHTNLRVVVELTATNVLRVWFISFSLVLGSHPNDASPLAAAA